MKKVLLTSGQVMEPNQVIEVGGGQKVVLKVSEWSRYGGSNFEFKHYDKFIAWWGTGNLGAPVFDFQHMIMEKNGDLSIWALFGSDARKLWSSGTDGNPGAYLQANSETAQLEIIKEDEILWTSRSDQEVAGLIKIDDEFSSLSTLGSPSTGWCKLNGVNQLELFDQSNKVKSKMLITYNSNMFFQVSSIKLTPYMTFTYENDFHEINSGIFVNRDLYSNPSYRRHLEKSMLKVDWDNFIFQAVNGKDVVWDTYLNEKIALEREQADVRFKSAVNELALQFVNDHQQVGEPS